MPCFERIVDFTGCKTCNRCTFRSTLAGRSQAVFPQLSLERGPRDAEDLTRPALVTLGHGEDAFDMRLFHLVEGWHAFRRDRGRSRPGGLRGRLAVLHEVLF